jgi:hypothetical protein
LKLKTPSRDGTKHRVMSSLEFMQLLARSGSYGHDWTTKDYLAAVNLGSRMPGSL